MSKERRSKALSEFMMLGVVMMLTILFILADAKLMRADSNIDMSANIKDGSDISSEVDNTVDSEANGAVDSTIESTTESIIESTTESTVENIEESTSKAVDEVENIDNSTEVVDGNDNTENIQEPNSEESQEEVKEIKQPEFTQAPQGYFDDALFIGDSRSVGLFEYGEIEGADFFATKGMSVYNIDSEKVSVGDKGTMEFNNLISQYSYGKIYIMLGINELGYDMDETIVEYGKLVERVQKAQPDAIIFIEANLHVSAKRSAQDVIYNNQNINYINENISLLADNKNIFYIDVNQLFDDEGGNLRADTTTDETHVLGRYYKQWADWLAQNAILKLQNN